MDERKIKRLVILLAMAIIVIFIAKFLLTKAVTNLGNAASTKKPPVVVQPVPEPASEVPFVEPLSEAPASAVEDASAPASAVEMAEPASAPR